MKTGKDGKAYRAARAHKARKGDYVLKNLRGTACFGGGFRSRAQARKAAVAKWGPGGYVWVQMPSAAV
jgi:hypothetical protein